MTAAAGDDAVRAAERVARTSYGRLLALLAVRGRDIASAEDALSEALVAALATWPERGVPANPEAWLVTAARNRLANDARAGAVRRRAAPEVERRASLPAADEPFPDERLGLMFACAHPAIDPSVRAPLILQTVLGLDAAAIARAFLVEPATMSQRLVRAKARIRDAGIRFALPEPERMPDRLAAVLDAIYAAFGRGWDGWEDAEAPEALSGEALWLARLVVDLMPGEPEAKGLLALMLYCTARRAARRDADGRFVPLALQDARRWDGAMVADAERLLVAAAAAGRFGRFQCEAAIQSVHVQRAVTGRLNVEALVALYDLLVDRTDGIGARIGRAVVLAEAGRIADARSALEALPAGRVAAHQPYWVALGHVLALAADPAGAKAALERAMSLTSDRSVRAHLAGRLADLRET